MSLQEKWKEKWSNSIGICGDIEGVKHKRELVFAKPFGNQWNEMVGWVEKGKKGQNERMWWEKKVRGVFGVSRLKCGNA